MNRLSTQSLNLTPEQFEAVVEILLREAGAGLSELKVQRLEKIHASDGIYEIDVTARFEAFGASFLVLIECKHHKNPIKREVVQVLRDRLQAVGAHKGMIFSTAKFQKGAIEYAQAHGIGLVQIVAGMTDFEETRACCVNNLKPLNFNLGWIERKLKDE
ncbi:MAG TPA: restriction endonuclease [Pyrinomonadaceae bacterium]